MRRHLSLHKILLAALVPLLIVFMQNCSRVNSSGAPKGTESQSTGGSGVPYDGKPYIYAGYCADGSVESRLSVLDSKSQKEVYLMRENCADVVPRLLAVTDYKFETDGTITYQSHIFTPETSLPQKVAPLSSWYNQYSQPLKAEQVSVYIIDAFNYDAATLQSLRNSGARTICSLTVGYYENWTPDATQFAAADYDGETLDTRSTNVRKIVSARFDMAKAKGCEFVSMDGFETYQSRSKFPLTAATALEYAQFLTNAAASRGLRSGLHNAADLAGQLAPMFELAIVRQCFANNNCSSYQSFTQQGKAVFAAEFTAFSQTQCNQAKAASISLAYFTEARDGSRFEPCP